MELLYDKDHLLLPVICNGKRKTQHGKDVILVQFPAKGHSLPGLGEIIRVKDKVRSLEVLFHKGFELRRA